MVAKIGSDGFPGHRIARPAHWRAPFIFACPHAGRQYPSRFIAETRLSLLELRRSEDAYVDALLPEAEAIGVPILYADFPRAFVDVNRAPDELDPLLFDGPVAAASPRSNRVLAGFGVVPRLAAEGRQIYTKRLPAAEARARVKWCYEPYHASLRALITECLTQFGEAVIIDWHSMPSRGGGRTLPQIVLGDRFGAACAEGNVRDWETAFGAAGLKVVRNTPYAGGYVTSLYGRPAQGIHALQIEVNRSLYLDEGAVARSDAFSGFRETILSAAERVVGSRDALRSFAAE
ncbi:N-formylglutamate amidohydrolase [Parvularcula oceani]|uniref:N-formylglutamate amidohydrolase n=1 Tax=Parvularcula oceani TaxID=1247963 RepID=UPI00068D4DF8|nr:N-formylglutamate amidohydrolase [Parvularcula oceani]